MKREKTEHPNIKKDARSGIYYYRKGDSELSLKTTDFKIAKDKTKNIESTIDNVGELVALRLKVGELFPDYLDDCKLKLLGRHPTNKTLSVGTYKLIEYISNKHLLKFFDKVKLLEINRAWPRYCDQATVSDLQNHRMVMWGFLKWCKRETYINQLPDISEIPRHKRRARRIIKNDELRKIFMYARGNILLFLSFALFMGLRRTEIMTLRWENINFNERFLVIEDVFNKRRRRRELPINDMAFSLLEAKKAEQSQKLIRTKWVFSNANDPKRHASVNGLKTAYHRVLEKAFNTPSGDPKKRMDITWHDFRATFEKWMDKSTIHTDMQKQKFSDATKDVRQRIYVSFDANDLRGLEEVVRVEGLNTVITRKLQSRGNGGESNI